MFFSGESKLKVPCERFIVIYKIWGSKDESYAMAREICLEQTVEFPGELVPEGLIADNIVGRIESFEPYDSESFKTSISYPAEGTANEFTQLLNIVFGNISLKPGIRVERLELPEVILKSFKGPRFGREGLRELLGVKKRPLLFTALKPLGLTNKELAELAYKFALGGIDIIKDDHGISNQAFSPFEERVKLCSEAVQKANNETGYKSIYMPNITSGSSEVVKRALKAKKLGAGGLLISPGLTGLDIMKDIAEDDHIALPIISHPAFQGSYVMSNNGISHQALFGQIARLAGADATIYPNFGGRFSFTREECVSIAHACEEKIGNLKNIFPCPAGGMSLESIPESLKVYGNDVIFLIGGGLFKHGPDIIENSKYFRSLIEQLSEN
ncbi:RuBisCO large subunit C-terminal-like domain-containing protein [Clostridium estertheticum]|uniref:RuBisCO large subunit C-terminal-like domain-containing protein n=1 Tax=Clostridium estertheticum TaxID=238834 RepID=UPI001CF307F1|nr:RuBisCO large subunit C-terminal-like domain-containing protein [Clostridium estertheticum]MCB2362319.1 ribulose 1,5-bisphosphate carboxylase large subunit [Clostridium estertheticum]